MENIPEGHVLRLENVSKSFGGVKALNRVSLRLDRKKIVGLIGPNGAGKSTLFNVTTSFYKPDEGDVFLENKRITGITPYRICRMGISRTFQLVRTFTKMTAYENVLVGALYGHKLRGKHAHQSAMEALELVDLAGKKNIVTAHLTLSDRRLLEVARALASMPAVVLLDEPMAGLNPSEIVKMLQIINRARDERDMGILWVEHKVDAVFHLCDHIVVLDYGTKIAEDTSENIARNDKVIEAYLGKKSAKS